MTILVTGSTGTVGSQVVAQLAQRGADVRALVRSDEQRRKLPAGVTPVIGDLTDVDSMRLALKGARTLFLLNAVTPDELTQALVAFGLAREAGIERFVYFSVIHAERYTDVPHFTGKHAVERMIEQFDLPVTILRPAYFMQNDLSLRDALVGKGVYPMPVGNTGAAMVDTRDLAEVAALHLMKRDVAAGPLPREVLDIVGPEALTGPAVAGLWSEALGRPIQYGGDDTAAFEQQMKAYAPGWMAYDMRLMMNRIQKDGMLPEQGDRERLTQLLGRPLRSYRDFAAEAAKQWQAG